VHICGDFHTVRPFGCKDMTKYKRGCFFMKHRVWSVHELVLEQVCHLAHLLAVGQFVCPEGVLWQNG